MNILPRKLNYIHQRSRQKVSHFIEDFIRMINYKSHDQSVINKKEIRVLGLRRSGNHAIINWIGKQSKGHSLFINHVKPLENPYRNKYESQLRSERNLHCKDWKYRDLSWWRQEKEGKFSFKDNLVYSYEDQEIERIAHVSFERKHDLYLGKSKERFDVIVMRDPFNLFASRLQAETRKNNILNFGNHSMLQVYSSRYSLPKLWISYAKECLGETNFLKNKLLFINYNKWFLDYDYRREVATQLGINFTDDGVNEVTRAGGGSSFDGASYSGKTQKMDVLNRWKLFTDNNLYRELLNTENLLNYANKLFGYIPGTEIFF